MEDLPPPQRARCRRPRAQLRGARWGALLLALTVLLAACSTSGDSETASLDQEEAEATAITESPGQEAMAVTEEVETEASTDTDTSAAAAPGASGQGTLGAGGATVARTPADLGRQIIFTANVEVGVDDVAAASAEATELMAARGGFLFGQNTVGGPEARSELTFKVLPADFNAALEALGTIGELRNQTVTTDDVTERIVDLDSRITVAELGVERLRGALVGTTDLADYAEVERLLLERESDLEVMRGQLRTLQDRVDLATIVLVLTQDRLANNIQLVVSAYEGHDGGRGCPGQPALVAPAGDAVTVCFDITNLGDQTLTDIALTDTVLGIEPGDDDLIEVFGQLASLPPGQAVTVAYETEAARTLGLRTRVTATPTDGVSDTATGPAVNTQTSYELQTFAPDRAPGFGDGFSAGRDVLQALWTAVTVAIGFALPLLVLAPLAWAAWLAAGWFRRRSARPGPGRPGAGRSGQIPPPPPPPPPSPAPVSGGPSPADREPVG